MENNNEENKDKKLNSISTFLYSFSLVFFEVLLIDLLISQENILDYKMNFTIGLILTFALISAITVMYMSKKFIFIVDRIKDNKVNLIGLVVGVVAIAYLLNAYLNYEVFSLSILPIIIIIVLMIVIARLIEKK